MSSAFITCVSLVKLVFCFVLDVFAGRGWPATLKSYSGCADIKQLTFNNNVLGRLIILSMFQLPSCYGLGMECFKLF